MPSNSHLSVQNSTLYEFKAFEFFSKRLNDAKINLISSEAPFFGPCIKKIRDGFSMDLLIGYNIKKVFVPMSYILLTIFS